MFQSYNANGKPIVNKTVTRSTKQHGCNPEVTEQSQDLFSSYDSSGNLIKIRSTQSSPTQSSPEQSLTLQLSPSQTSKTPDSQIAADSPVKTQERLRDILIKGSGLVKLKSHKRCILYKRNSATIPQLYSAIKKGEVRFGHGQTKTHLAILTDAMRYKEMHDELFPINWSLSSPPWQ